MPTLSWIGKEKVINHHREVPFKILEHKYGFSADKGESEEPVNSGNKIIHGDNLEALKSLLPEYEGKIKCIYIDPPYNTGNENWVYNDNVNHPKIRKWLETTLKAKENGKEATIGIDDMARHDKWLCMMYPRLQLLHKLLEKNGVIFISIDDIELNFLKIICDEIFGSSSYLTSFVWRRRASSQLSQNNISVDHEYVIAYSKKESKFHGIKKDYKSYSNPDNDPKGSWTLGDLTVGMTKSQRPNQFFDLEDPKTGIIYHPSPKRVWTYAPETMMEKINEGRVIFPKNGKSNPMYKRYLNELKTDINPLSSWLSNEAYQIGLNSEGTKIIQSFFEEKVFDYPKPVSLLTLLISQVTSNSEIVLDTFAGSGTTAHAVLNLNKQDGGKRKFILVEMEDYANTITSERVKRVINGNSEVTGLGGSFNYYELGKPLFTGENSEFLNEEVGTDKIKEYIWFSETRTAWGNPDLKKESQYFLGKKDDTAYYFIYEKDSLTTLDYDLLSTIKSKAGQYVIYADNCLLAKDFMMKHNIIFKKIPRDITRF
jgi:adenine-specific DNA-methyltransferase